MAHWRVLARRAATGCLGSTLLIGCDEESTAPGRPEGAITPTASAAASTDISGTIVQLPPLWAHGHYESRATDVNEHGDIVGWTYTERTADDRSDNSFRATVWPGDGSAPRELRPLGPPPDPDAPWDPIYSEGHAINGRGDVIGVSRIGSDVFRATHWPADGGAPRELQSLGGSESQASDINDRGDIVGSSETATGVRRPTLWPANGGPPRDLGTLGGPAGGASGINERGDIVGASQTADNVFHATLWPADGGAPRDLGALGGSYPQSSATAINERGDIAGYSFTPAGAGFSARAMLWPAGGGPPRELVPLPGLYPSSVALGINDRGDVVGHTHTRATLWPADGGLPQDLGVPDGSMESYALSVSDAYVVGHGQGNGPRAIRWTLPPTTPPSDPGSVIRIYKDHDAWRARADGGRDEATLTKMGKVKGKDFSVHPMSSLAAGIPAGTRVVIITANSRGDPATSAAQRSEGAQRALLAFLESGGTLLVDLADGEAAQGYRVPGASGTPSFTVPTSCADATLAPAAYGADGVPGTADDHRFVRGPDGVAGTEDDLNDETIDLAHGGSHSQADMTAPGLARGCAVAHGNLQDGFRLPPDAHVLATATWGDARRAVLAEYRHAGGHVIVNTFTLGAFAHKPREGRLERLRSTYIQRSLFAYALNPEVWDQNCVAAPPDQTVGTDPGLATARVDVGTATTTDNCPDGPITISAARSDGVAALDAPYKFGTTIITWTGRDGAGRAFITQQRIVVEDREPPVLSVHPDIVVDATDANGARVKFKPVGVGMGMSSVDNVSPGSEWHCRGSPSPNVDSGRMFPIGVNTISCLVWDHAGNSSIGSFTVTVRGAPEQLAKLINIVNGSKIVASYKAHLVDILSKVRADARSAPEPCRGLDSFVAEVTANAGTLIPADKATRMLADARRIIAVLWCAPHYTANGYLEGRIGKPAILGGLAGAKVTVTGGPVAGFSTSVTADGTGHYRVDNLSPGSYTVTVEAPGYFPARESVQIATAAWGGAYAELWPLPVQPVAIRLRPEGAGQLHRDQPVSYGGDQTLWKTSGLVMQANASIRLEPWPAPSATWSSSDPTGRKVTVDATGLVTALLGNDDPGSANEAHVTAVAQASPNPSSTIRINAFSFDHYPRLLTAAWRPVAGAATYAVTVEAGDAAVPGCGGLPLDCTRWRGSNRIVTTATQFTFDFMGEIGPTAGRWRVVALDAAGRMIFTSEYNYFAFLAPKRTWEEW